MVDYESHTEQSGLNPGHRNGRPATGYDGGNYQYNWFLGREAVWFGGNQKEAD